jgi:hypothetical protein
MLSRLLSRRDEGTEKITYHYTLVDSTVTETQKCPVCNQCGIVDASKLYFDACLKIYLFVIALFIVDVVILYCIGAWQATTVTSSDSLFGESK